MITVSLGSRRARSPRMRLPLALTAATVALAACGSSGSESEEGSDGVTDMTITVSGFPITSPSVPYVVGMERGFFEEEGIRITEVAGSGGGGDTVRNVLSGDFAFGDVSTPSAVQAHVAGADISMISGAVKSVGDLNFVAKKGSGISNVEDLVGQRVAYTSAGSVTEGVLALSLEAAGIDPSEVQGRALGGVSEALTALDSDAVVAAPYLEPMYSSEPDKYDVIWWVDDLVPQFQQTVIIAGKDILESSPEVVESFLRAYERSVEFIGDSPDEAAELWAAKADFPVEATRGGIDTYLGNEQWGTAFSAEGLQAVDHEMRLIELVAPDTEIPWEDMVVQDFLPDGSEEIDPSTIGESE